MCHSSTPWLCPALCSSYQPFLGEDKENQSTLQLDTPLTSTMPPLHAARLVVLTPGLQRNPFVILAVLCSLVIILVLATRKRKKTRQLGALATQHRLKQHKGQDIKLRSQVQSNDAACFDFPASQPLSYFPPPPGSLLSSEPPVGQIPLLHANSGTLAAQATAKIWPDPSLRPEAELRQPWRRHSDPLLEAIHVEGTKVLITSDTNQYFDDADLQGFWRRRTLEFA